MGQKLGFVAFLALLAAATAVALITEDPLLTVSISSPAAAAVLWKMIDKD